MAIRLGASSYSYQDEYALGLMTLEDTMAALSAAGGTGYEAILEQMLPGGNFMHLSDEFVEQWYDLLEKYGLEPTCADIFDDFNLFRNRTLTEREQLNQMEHYLSVANRLGFTTARVLANTPLDVLEKAFPMAEDYNVKLGLEIHAPLTMKSRWALDWMERIDKAGTKYAGIIPDFGIFGLRPLTINVAAALRASADPEICDFIVEEYKKNAKKRAMSNVILENASPEEMMTRGAEGSVELEEKVRKMGGGPLEIGLVNARLSYDNPMWLAEYMDKIVHIHAKFYEMVEDGEGGYADPNIDTAAAVRVLRDYGYSGWISSEYEGHGFFREPGLEIYPDGPEQVRRHHVMLRKILSEPYTGKLKQYNENRRKQYGK